MVRALGAYADDVRTRRFPAPEHTYGIAPEELQRLADRMKERQRA
jgi:3-methyl-2-oxobutanoate hydroxymethyltransferase